MIRNYALEWVRYNPTLPLTHPPKDGTPILVALRGQDHAMRAAFDKTMGHWFTNCNRMLGEKHFGMWRRA